MAVAMARLAAKRDTHLTREEIAAEVLRQFDEGPREPSIRSLAAALHVTPTAIYHHFPSQAAIYQAAVELIRLESVDRLLEQTPRPLEDDPLDVLVAAALGIRRAFLAHHRAARYMAATPPADELNARSLAVIANLFERLGIEGEDAAVAFHAYASFMFGAVLFAAERMSANEQLEGSADPRAYRPVGRTRRRTKLAVEKIPDLSLVDPARDEELFASGVRRLVESYVPASAKRRR